MNAAWVEGMRERSVLEVARALGLAIDERRHALAPCPACGAERRHTKAGDRRGAVGVRPDGRGWKCFQCETTGDALELVAQRIGGGRLRDLGDVRKAEVREWCSRFLGLDVGGIAGSQARKLAPLQPRVVPPPPPPRYPPADELAELWASCVPVTDDEEVSGYLAGRGLDPVRLADLDAVRALPVSAPCPAWAGAGEGEAWRSWAARGARLVVPLVDATGAVRSALARFPWKVEHGPKSFAAKGCQRSGLVMACPLARQVLELGGRPSWWDASAPTLRVVVAEGEPDFLTWASACSEADENAPAVLGIVEGSWTPELAARVPDGAELVVRTHDDEPKADGSPGKGAKYAARILETLAPRMAARRLVVRLAPWFVCRVDGERMIVERKAAAT